MKLVIDILDPRWKPGDFVRYSKSEVAEDFNIVARVLRVNYDGRWRYSGEKIEVEEGNYNHYLLVCQSGCRSVDGNPIRPGTILGESIAVLDQQGEKIHYRGKVWDQDTRENLIEREDSWEKKQNVVA